jgi:polyribonucleotide nucleotidyltransferase
VYDGKVTSIKDFGAFIEILPGRDGLCHISELDDKYVGKVDDVCKVGDHIQVKVIAIDEHDRVKLSRKALLREQNPAGAEGGQPPSSAPPPRRDDDRRGPRSEGPPRERRPERREPAE